MENETLWKTVLSDLQVDLSEAVFRSFLAPTKLLKKEKNILEIGCPNRYCKEKIEERYYGQIKRVVDKITKEKNELVFVIGDQEREQKTRLGPLFEREPLTPSFPPKATGLSPIYTLENFVVGSSNNLAYAVAQGVILNPGKVHNPYFLYADVGLGKTHLIQAIGNAIVKKSTKLKVLYCTSEDFTNELIQAMQRKRTALFKNKFRRTDILLIDDIQFLAGKDTIQEEFFHTFNALYHAQKQIVLTSDKPPKEITKLEERLSSRFGCGMIADIQPPDYGTRVAILRSKRDQYGYSVDDTVLDRIAEAIDSNIRDLEGALERVVTISKTEGVKITPELVEEAIGKNNLKLKKRISPQKILTAVCTYYSVKKRDIIGRRRPKEIAFPRQVSMFLLRTLTDLPLMGVGEILGGRDHTTIMYGAEKIEKGLKKDAKLRQDVLNIKQSLG